MHTVQIALDWPTNILHAGILLAQQKNWYAEENINVQLSSTADDICRSSPLKSVTNGCAHIAIAPSESLISFKTQREHFDLVAIAALSQKDTSAVVTHKLSGINSPAQMDGKIYASYRGRFENAIIRQLIINAGGNGMMRFVYPDKFKAWDEFIAGKVDCIWVHCNREGFMAKMLNVALNYFTFTAYGIPYGYNPIMITSSELLKTNASIFKAFLAVTARGYEFVSHYPAEAVNLIKPDCKFSKNFDSELLAKCLESTPNIFLDADGNWGKMDIGVWKNYLEWMDEHNIVTDLETKNPIKVAPLLKHIFSNNYLPVSQFF